MVSSEKNNLKTFQAVLLIIGITTLIGGVYGILHDQLTYTISEEFYTKVKFRQFGLMDLRYETTFANPRIQVSIVGILATWWMGPPIGLILGLVCSIYTDSKQLFSTAMKAVMVTALVAFATGLIGLAYGKLYLAKIGVYEWLPENLTDSGNFIAVSTMHKFSYMGGLTGLVAGIIYILIQNGILRMDVKKRLTLAEDSVENSFVSEEI